MAVSALVVAVLAGVGVGVVLINRDGLTPAATGPGSTTANAPAPSPADPAETPGLQPTGFPKPEQPNTQGPPPDLAGAYARVRSGVVRVLASTCAGTGVGTAYLTDARTALTALGSVDRAVAVVVVVRGRPIPATVSSVSPGSGLATLRLARPVVGHRFRLAAGPSVGQPVGVVGVPVSKNSPALTEAAVTATDARGSGLSRLLALEGSADLGLNGAPVVDGSGGVVGMVVADENETALKAVPAPTLERAGRERPDKGSCGRPSGPQIPTAITGDAPRTYRATLQRYFAGINSGNYDAVFDAFEPGVLKGSRSRIEEGFRSTYDFNVRIEAWQGPNVWVRFDSIFAEGRGPDRLTCARWSRVFIFREAGGRARISRVENRTGVPLYRPC